MNGTDLKFTNIENNSGDGGLMPLGGSLYGKGKKRSPVGIIINVVLCMLIIILLGTIIFNSVYTGLYVVHSSMYPTLTGAEDISVSGGDYVYIKEGARPDYGDIVVVYDTNKKTNIIKRVVAFGGDEVKIEGGKLKLKRNGLEEFEEVNEYYVSPECNVEGVNVNALYFNYPADGSNYHTVADNCMFLLGDNRNDSDDSRNGANGKNGDYSLENLVGVVPAWSVKYKKFSTAFYTFFHFTLRGK